MPDVPLDGGHIVQTHRAKAVTPQHKDAQPTNQNRNPETHRNLLIRGSKNAIDSKVGNRQQDQVEHEKMKAPPGWLSDNVDRVPAECSPGTSWRRCYAKKDGDAKTRDYGFCGAARSYLIGNQNS
jgi:hypothetical protein